MADPFTTGLEDDPAADFLAREQQELAGLEDDGFGGPIPDTTATSDPSQYINLHEKINDLYQVVQDYSAISQDGLDFFAGSEASSNEKPIENDLFGETDMSSAVDYSLDGLTRTEVNGTDESESTTPPQKILIWREEQQKKIAEKDKNEEVKMEEWRATAKRELEEWYARQAEQVEKHKKNNRVAEAEFVKERDETTPGNEWERISRLCDFNPKNNKNTKDVSRMRSILLQLKQNPLQRAVST